jgi:hypothetical protein
MDSRAGQSQVREVTEASGSAVHAIPDLEFIIGLESHSRRSKIGNSKPSATTFPGYMTAYQSSQRLAG